MKSIDHKYHHQLNIGSRLSYCFLIDGEHYTGEIKSISLNGLFLSEPRPSFSQLHVSRIGELKIKFDGEWQTLKCEVVYVENPENDIFPIGAGLVFCDTDDVINSLITKLNIAIEQLDFSIISELTRNLHVGRH